MNLGDTNLSRTTSRASARSRNSTLSRNQSLIKRNIELQDLRPADVLIERFVAWKAIVKQLTAYFEGIADIENNTAKELTKLAGVIQVPFRAGNQFLGQGGLQDVFYDIRDKTRIIADQHADLGRTIDSSIVQHLQKLRAEIKAHIKNVQNDTGKLAAGVAREREQSTKLVGELANAISTFKNTPMQIQAKSDPFVANQAVAHQLQRQVLEENLLQKSIVMMQQNSAHFEEGIVKSIQSAWQTFDEWQSRASAASQEIFRSLSTHLASLAPDREWIQFAARSDHLLDPDTPLRDPELITYPLKDDPSVVPVHTGHLERKRRFTRAYTECYFVLTPAGFLHEFASSDPATPAGQTPAFSLFLPSCTLGPASSPRARANKFHIEGRKDGLGTTKSGSFKGLLGGEATKAWSFRARSREDMMEWWNDVRMLCARYLVASEQVDRTGPVEEAVRSAGYHSEDLGEEVETEEEEVTGDERERHPPPVRVAEVERREGSSVEEEVDAETYDHDQPPVYTHPAGEKHYPEMGPHGYVIEKKAGLGAPYNTHANGNYHLQPTHPNFHHAPTLARNQHGDVQSHHVSVAEMEPEGDTTNVDTTPPTPGEGGARTSRRMSKRAMEKAPEGVHHQQPPAVQTTTNQLAQPPPIQMSHDSAPHYGHTYPSGRLRSPPPPSKEAHPEGEDDNEGMYAPEDVDQGGDEAERGRGRAGNGGHRFSPAPAPATMPVGVNFDEEEGGNGHHVEELGGPDSEAARFGDTTSHRTSLSGDATAKSLEGAAVSVGA